MKYTHLIVNQIEQLLTEYPESNMIARIRETKIHLELNTLFLTAVCIMLGINISIALERGFNTLIIDGIFVYIIITIILSAITLIKARDYVTALTIYEPSRKFDSAREYMQYEKSNGKKILDLFRWLAW